MVTTTHDVIATSKVDTKAAWLILPRLAWLGYASYVSISTAASSRDDLFHPEPEKPAQV